MVQSTKEYVTLSSPHVLDHRADPTGGADSWLKAASEYAAQPLLG